MTVTLQHDEAPMLHGLALRGKRIIVTGASRGLGAAIARACAAAGAIVAVNYLHSHDAAAALVADHPQSMRLLQFDVRDAIAVADGVRRFVEQEGAVDALVNNAGVFVPGLVVRTKVEAIQDQIHTNLIGPMLCARAVLPGFLRAGHGVILNVSSVAADRPAKGQAIYAASKAGVEALTRALAYEYGDRGIRVNCLQLGPVETAMLAQVHAERAAMLSRIPLGRFGSVDEIAQFAVALLSDAAAFVTGAVHTLDGGYLRG